MIIPNGCIVFRKSVDGGMDSEGYPTATTEAWSECVACQVLPNVHLQSRSRGEATTAHAYTILIDRMELPSEVVKLCYEGKEIGQFSIHSYEHLDAVCQTKITL
jgi:hypothetical protein